MTAPTLATPAAEVERLRAELAELHHLVAALVVADPGPVVTLKTAQQWAVEAFARGRELGRREGYERCAADYERHWRETAAPAAHGGVAYAELDRRRYPPDGRLSWIIPKGDAA